MNLRKTAVLSAPMSLLAISLVGCNAPGTSSETMLVSSGETCPAAVRGDDHELKEWERHLDERERELDAREHELAEWERHLQKKEESCEGEDDKGHHEMKAMLEHVMKDTCGFHCIAYVGVL